MGKRLMGYFEEASKLGGLPARVSLAKYTAMSAVLAADAQETPEVLRRFEEAIVNVRRDYAGAAPSPGATPSATPAKSQRFNQLYAGLVKDKARFIGDLKLTAKRVTEASAEALEIARASIWLYDGKSAIECLDLFERPAAKHSSGLKLFAKDFPAYFKALEIERAIDAADAHTDPRTACFSAPYLKPLGINSMLDIPIWSGKRMAGVICQEHIGPTRRWLPEEADFGVALASFVSEAMERRG